MSDSALRRQPIDLDEFERRLRSSQVDQARGPAPTSRQAGPAMSADPMAELARVVGQGGGSPGYAPAGRPPAAPPPRAPVASRQALSPAAPSSAAPSPAVPPPPSPRPVQRVAPPSAAPGPLQATQPPRGPAGLRAPPTRAPAPEPSFYPQTARGAPAMPSGGAYGGRQPVGAQDSAYSGDPFYDDEAFESGFDNPAAQVGVAQAIGGYQTPYADDLYADEDEVFAPPAPDFGPQGRPPKKGRSFLVTAGAVVLLLAGIGAVFSLRGGNDPAKEAPTIFAKSTPSKVQPPVEASSSDATPSMLDKGPSDTSGPIRIVNRQEQPIDIGQANRAAGQTTPSNPGSAPFGEPKHVRTIAVRPDGTVISPTPQSVAGGNPSGIPALAANPGAGNVRTTGLPLPVAPVQNPQAAANSALAGSARPPIRTIAATPQTTRTQVADAAPYGADPGAVLAEPKPAASTPSLKPALAAPKPSATANALNATNGSGAYAVQLAAAGSEDEARDRIVSYTQKYSSVLGGRRLGAKQGDANGRTVWRVRVGGMSKEDAVQLCMDLKASGGSCFVAAN